MITLKRASVVDSKGQTWTGRIAARREKTNQIYVMIDGNPSLDDWYNTDKVSEIN